MLTAVAVADGIAAFKPQMDPLRSQLVKYLRGDDLARVRGWLSNAEERGLPEEIARQWAEQFESFGLLDVARIAGQVDEPVASVAHVYFTVFDRFDIDDLLERITALPREDRWQSLARAALRDDLYTTVTDITVAVMQSTEPGEQAEARIDEWEQANAENIKRVRDMFEEVNQAGAGRHGLVVRSPAPDALDSAAVAWPFSPTPSATTPTSDRAMQNGFICWSATGNSSRDLAFADLALWFPTPDGSYVALAHVRPSTTHTVFHRDFVGERIRADLKPLVDAARQSQTIERSSEANWTTEMAMRVEAVPMVRNGRTLAIVTSHMDLSSSRMPVAARTDLPGSAPTTC